jgi:hypothetical protein
MDFIDFLFSSLFGSEGETIVLTAVFKILKNPGYHALFFNRLRYSEVCKLIKIVFLDTIDFNLGAGIYLMSYHRTAYQASTGYITLSTPSCPRDSPDSAFNNSFYIIIFYISSYSY